MASVLLRPQFRSTSAPRLTSRRCLVSSCHGSFEPIPWSRLCANPRDEKDNGLSFHYPASNSGQVWFRAVARQALMSRRCFGIGIATEQPGAALSASRSAAIEEKSARSRRYNENEASFEAHNVLRFFANSTAKEWVCGQLTTRALSDIDNFCRCSAAKRLRAYGER